MTTDRPPYRHHCQHRTTNEIIRIRVALVLAESWDPLMGIVQATAFRCRASSSRLPDRFLSFWDDLLGEDTKRGCLHYAHQRVPALCQDRSEEHTSTPVTW